LAAGAARQCRTTRRRTHTRSPASTPTTPHRPGRTPMSQTINTDYDYEPTHYFVAVAGTIVAGPMEWDKADAERAQSEEYAEPGESVELVTATRADLDAAGIAYRVADGA